MTTDPYRTKDSMTDLADVVSNPRPSSEDNAGGPSQEGPQPGDDQVVSPAGELVDLGNLSQNVHKK